MDKPADFSEETYFHKNQQKHAKKQQCHLYYKTFTAANMNHHQKCITKQKNANKEDIENQAQN